MRGARSLGATCGSANLLETEPEKVSYFCDQLKVPMHFLPSKIYCGQKTSQPTVRYFVAKFPMFFDGDSTSSSTVVTFTYLQGPEASLTEFVHHLQAYLPLFRQLSEFRFIYLARLNSHFAKAKELFNSTAAIPDSIRRGALRASVSRMESGPRDAG